MSFLSLAVNFEKIEVGVRFRFPQEIEVYTSTTGLSPQSDLFRKLDATTAVNTVTGHEQSVLPTDRVLRTNT